MIGKVHYNFCFINSAWKWMTTDPEYVGPRSFQIRIRDPKMWSTPTKIGASYNVCLIKCSPNYMVEAAEALQALFRAPLWGVRLWGQIPVKNLSPIEEYPYAKFHWDWSSALDFYSRYTRTYTHTHWLLIIRLCCIHVYREPQFYNDFGKKENLLLFFYFGKY